jgi:UDP-N-acetyl-D-glucosamine dehydrogenase
LVATGHNRFEYDLLRKHARRIVDSRGKYLEPAPNIVKA